MEKWGHLLGDQQPARQMLVPCAGRWQLRGIEEAAPGHTQEAGLAGREEKASGASRLPAGVQVDGVTLRHCPHRC